MTSTLKYFFNPIYTLVYSVPISIIVDISNSMDVIPITMPNNNGSQSVFVLNTDKQYYYTLNKIYISLTPTNITNSNYSIVLQGNRNDYYQDETNQILVIIPIMYVYNDNTTTSNIIDGFDPFSTPYNIPSGMDLNKLIPTGTYNEYTTTYNKIGYEIILFNNSTLFALSTRMIDDVTPPLINRLTMEYSNVSGVATKNTTNISSSNEEDIYIDCQPTTELGKEVDNYISLNKSELNLVNINYFRLWILRIFTIIILILIIYGVIKIFEVKKIDLPNVTIPIGTLPKV
uniref:Uncharacterized protein n=1 Tax=viral metagenome TaxID=1070528 RepID=A0A6C0EV18_9ZZZZ